MKKICNEIEIIKSRCKAGYTCVGWNPDSYDSKFGQCLFVDNQFIWRKHFDEKKFAYPYELFIDQFDVEVYDTPGKYRGSLNTYWGTKYGLHTC